MHLDPKIESQKIATFVQTVFKHTGKSTAIIGLSGGIDSAVSFTLILKALGSQNIHAFHLPSKTTNPQHLKDVQLLTSSLKLPAANFHIIPIGSIIQKSWRIIHRHCGPRAAIHTNESWIPGQARDDDRLRLANLTARIRMMILFDQAKKYDGLVIGTENKSESMLGYFTRFGDAASDLEPIAHLFKTQVIELAKHLNIPTSIIQKKPSADLWKGQTDETELGFSYAEADPILDQISMGKDPTGILAEKVKVAVNKVAFKSQVPYVIPHSKTSPLI